MPKQPAASFRCDGCGLCCRHLLVEADWSDVLREPRIAQECPNQVLNNPPVLDQCWILYSQAKGACPFLSDANRCGIYPTRPNGCVTFAAGSPRCQELRADAGLAPLGAISGQNLLDQINASVVEYDREDQE
jgi:Fe-S-cluster containining protein